MARRDNWGSQDDERKEKDILKHGDHKNEHKKKPPKSSEAEKAEAANFRNRRKGR